MRPRSAFVLLASAIVAGSFAAGCYTDDISGLSNGKSVVRVLLTDSPFPFDSVASANVYVDSIEASATTDTTATAWVTVAAPHQAFNLLAVQQGVTALVGQGQLSVGQYRAVRMTIDVDSSSIVWRNGSRAQVNWPQSGRMTLNAFVQPPFSVGNAGADIVLDFDVGQSFPYNLFGDGHFDFIPWLRAVNGAATGAIAGTVSTSYTGTTLPVKSADITVYAGTPPTSSEASPVVATGHTDSTGHYRVAFLSPGTYTLGVSKVDNPFLASVFVPGVQVTAGTSTTESPSLAAASGANASIHISGPSTVGVGGWITLAAAVVDSAGNPVANPAVIWTSSDTMIAVTQGFGAADTTRGRSAGSAYVTATSVGKRDSILVTVVANGSLDTIASVTVAPATASAAVGDSVGFTATLESASGGPLSGRSIAWFLSDTTIADLYPYGASAIVRPRRTGTVVVQATSEGKSGSASLTVH